VGLHGKVTKAV